MSQSNKHLHKDYSFWDGLQSYGVWNIVFSSDFILSVLLTLLLSIFICYYGLVDFAKISGILVTVNAALLAVIIAGLAIIVSLSDVDFLDYLHYKAKILTSLIFLFASVSIVVGVGILVHTSVLLLSLYSQYLKEYTLMYVFLFGFFLTLWGIFGTIGLVITTGKYGIARVRHNKYVKNQ